ncbi:hypothetical protein [Terriglobus tenax]|uniref:hypothetical protein n=1 Tax=Terriglobus tenax TaxID=1111115 RepID=UPI0021E0E92A|nr:hypothetical protein [Terriglobus tenax]
MLTEQVLEIVENKEQISESSSQMLKQHEQLVGQLQQAQVQFGNTVRPAYEDALSRPTAEMMYCL